MTRALVTLITLLALAACDTVAGAGTDIQKAGAAITDQAKQTQSGM
ncbi:MAG: entericidin, EcnA/B family [Rhodobacteraceae bacterium]|nr:entericidin, EcnA/B family [Paracoccaceae bacterium]